MRAVRVKRHNGKIEVNVVAQILREERTDRAVDNAGCEYSLLGGLALAAVVAAGDMSYGVELFLKVDRQRQKVDTGARTRGCGRVAEHGGVAVSYEAGAVCKSCHLACFNYERATCELVFKGSEIFEHFVPPWNHFFDFSDGGMRIGHTVPERLQIIRMCTPRRSMSDVTGKAAHRCDTPRRAYSDYLKSEAHPPVAVCFVLR